MAYPTASMEKWLAANWKLISEKNNLPGVIQKRDLVLKVLWKEERSHLLITFSGSMSRLNLDIRIIKLSIVKQEGKKYYLYIHCSRITKSIWQSVNKCYNTAETEAKIKYGTVFDEYYQLLWSIAAHYPGSSIDMYNVNITSAFLQLLFFHLVLPRQM